MEHLATLGVLLVLAGVLAVVAGLVLMGARGGEAKVTGGGVLFLGPIPLVFGTDRKAAVGVAAAAVVLMVAYNMFMRR